MHDPLVVAFEIHRPWPKRVNWKGRRYYFPAIVTVWHREPGGHDSGEVCRRRDRIWHVHHWKVQVQPLQALRRRLLTRCAWCHARHSGRTDAAVNGRPNGAVNVSHSWDGPRAPWWRGEVGLFHMECSMVAKGHAGCVCDAPILEHDGWGRCYRCRKHIAWGDLRDPWKIEQRKFLQTVPHGVRPSPEVYAEACAIYKRSRDAVT